MKNYVSYHSAERIGYEYSGANPFSLVTSKSIKNIEGNRVWSISGHGNPREYWLRETWIADEVGEEEDGGDFTRYVKGTEGYCFLPPVHLNVLPWFRDFVESRVNFSIGFGAMQEAFVEKFESLLESHREEIAVQPSYDDLPGDDSNYPEGSVSQVLRNSYERSEAARDACIRHHGTTCVVCCFNFGQKYGPKVEGLIHVHHLRELSAIGKLYLVDPILDLRPVCPNCHAVIHSCSPAMSIQEVRKLLWDNAPK
ncbi:MAG TPA: hypothetical protein VM260_01380 [Pirellula sp.]|nr:hypothetical protein [Pirellula sp.]